MAGGARWLALPVVVGVLLAGCGGGAGSPGAGEGGGSRSASPSDHGPDVAAVEEQLAGALPADRAIGYPRDEDFEASTQSHGLTSRTLFHCVGTAAAESDAQRVTRVERRWFSPGWGKAGREEVQVRMDLVTYRGDGRRAALDELEQVPTTCPRAYGEDGAARKHEFYRESRGPLHERDVVGVFARLRYVDNGSRAYEVTFAAEAGGHSLGLLVLISNDMGELKAALDRVQRVFVQVLDRLDAGAGELA